MLTRQEVMELIGNIKLPEEWNGMRLVRQELCIGESGFSTRTSAKKELNKIRRWHNPNNGWRSAGEKGEGIFKDADNLWYPFRLQALYA